MKKDKEIRKELRETYPIECDGKFVERWQIDLELKIRASFYLNPMEIARGNDYVFQCILDLEKAKIIDFLARSMRKGTLRDNIRIVDKTPICMEF